MASDRPDLDELLGIPSSRQGGAAVAERPDLDELLGISPESAVAPSMERPDLDELLGIGAPARKQPLPDLIQRLQDARIFGSATAAASGAWDKNIRRRQDGNWDLPALAANDGGFLDSAAGMVTTLAQKTGQRIQDSGPSFDEKPIQDIFHKFQQDNNLSDKEVETTWTDFVTSHRKWDEEEKTRVLSDGKIMLNPSATEILDDAAAHAIIDKSGASEESKAAAKNNLKHIQTQSAAAKLEAYEAATATLNSASGVLAPALQAAEVVGGEMPSPTEWAEQTGRKDLGTVGFVRDYERDVIGKQGTTMKWARGLANDWILGLNKLATTVLGVGGALGSETMAQAGATGSEATDTISQGKNDTGMAGTVLQELPSVAAQVVTGRLLGGLGALTGSAKAANAVAHVGTVGTAGAQSAGMTYAQQRAAGADHDTAQENALKAGVSTAVITGIFQGLGAGGVEKVAAGKAVGGVTMRDLLKSASREELVKNTRSFAANVLKATGGEFSEEGIDELTSQFLTAKPDTNLADAWDNAMEAAKAGGLIGGAVDVAAKTFETPIDPVAKHVQDTADRIAPVVPDTATALAETGTVTAPDGNPVAPDVVDPDSQAQEILHANAEDPTLPEAAEEILPEGVPEAGIQPTPGGQAVAGAEETENPTGLNSATLFDIAQPTSQINEPASTPPGTGPSPTPEAAPDGNAVSTEPATPAGVDEVSATESDVSLPVEETSSRQAMWTSGSLSPNAKNQFQTPVTLSAPKVENDVELRKAKFLPDGSVGGPKEVSNHFAEINVESVDGKATGVSPGSSAGKIGWHLMEDGSIHISSVRVPDRLQRQKLGSQLVKEVIKWRDANSPSSEIVFTTPSVEGSALQESFGTRLQPTTPTTEDIPTDTYQPDENTGTPAVGDQGTADAAAGESVTEAGVPHAEAPLDPNPPAPGPPDFDAALEDDSVTGLYHAQTDADRVRMGLPPRFKQPRTTDQDAWDRATAAEDAHRAAGKPGTAGTDLLTNLLNDVPRVLTKDEHALLLHEKLVREQAVENAQTKLNSLPANAPDGVRKDAQAEVKKAHDVFDLLITYADAAGSQAGLSLQARKMLVNSDFSLAAVENRLKAAKNMQSDKPTEWTEKDRAAAAEIATKLQQAQERIETLEAGNDEQTALIEQLTKDVEQAQTKLENRMRTTRARAAVKAKLDPMIEAARARIEARAKANRGVVNMALLPTPDMLADLKDYAIIYSSQFIKGGVTLSAFSEQVISELGDWIAPHVQNLFRMARAHYIETAESVSPGESTASTPESVVESIDATETLDKIDVWKLARAHVVAGKRGRNVLDAVFNDLQTKFPDITRDQVSEAFTGYGTVVYPSTKEVPAELRRIRSLEREYLKQLDIAAGRMPKRTGYQGDVKKGPEWAEVRAEQQKSLEALRELENQLRDAGLPVPSDERKLANALGMMKRRLANEIEEIELALKTKTARTPKARTPITPDAETADLQATLKEKRAEYDQVFKDESAREKRILGSIKKRRMELERRMREKDFSRPPAKTPVNTEAKRKADYEFAKLKAKYDEMRHQYMLANAPFATKAGHILMSSSNLLKLLTLGGDIGVVMRQLGTTYQAVTRDLGMLAPTKEGAKKRADGSYLKKIIGEGVKAFGNKEYEHAAYEKLKERKNAGWDKTAGLVLSPPFDEHGNSKEDIPPANLLDKIPWWIWPAVAGVKVTMLGASFPVSASILALGAVTKPFMQSLDRAQRTMTNQSRAMFFDAAINALHDGNPTVQEAKAIAKAVMVGTGRGTATQKIEAAIPVMNQVLLATRYYISRIQAASMYPLWNKDARQAPAARKEIQKMYARSVAGRAVLYGLAAMAFGKALTGDDDEPEEGLIVDPRNQNLGRVKLAEGVSLDFMSSINQYLSLAARMATKSKVDPKTGQKIALGAGYSDNAMAEATKFLTSKLNLQLSFMGSMYKGEFFGGKPTTPANVLDEMTTAIIVGDTFNVYDSLMKEYGPVEGAAKATVFLGMMFGGAGTSVHDSEARKEANAIARKEAEQARKMREAELNE